MCISIAFGTLTPNTPAKRFATGHGAVLMFFHRGNSLPLLVSKVNGVQASVGYSLQWIRALLLLTRSVIMGGANRNRAESFKFHNFLARRQLVALRI